MRQIPLYPQRRAGRSAPRGVMRGRPVLEKVHRALHQLPAREARGQGQGQGAGVHRAKPEGESTGGGRERGRQHPPFTRVQLEGNRVGSSAKIEEGGLYRRRARVREALSSRDRGGELSAYTPYI